MGENTFLKRLTEGVVTLEKSLIFFYSQILKRKVFPYSRSLSKVSEYFCRNSVTKLVDLIGKQPEQVHKKSVKIYRASKNITLRC